MTSCGGWASKTGVSQLLRRQRSYRLVLLKVRFICYGLFNATRDFQLSKENVTRASLTLASCTSSDTKTAHSQQCVFIPRRLRESHHLFTSGQQDKVHATKGNVHFIVHLAPICSYWVRNPWRKKVTRTHEHCERGDEEEGERERERESVVDAHQGLNGGGGCCFRR